MLIKTHEWTAGDTHCPITRAQFEEILPLFTHVIVSVRQGFPPDPEWIKVATYITKFEEIVQPDGRGALKVLRDLADHLGIGEQLTDHGLKWVDYRLMTLEIPKCGEIRTNKLWHFHKRRGGRQPPNRPPSPEFP